MAGDGNFRIACRQRRYFLRSSYQESGAVYLLIDLVNRHLRIGLQDVAPEVGLELGPSMRDHDLTGGVVLVDCAKLSAGVLVGFDELEVGPFDDAV